MTFLDALWTLVVFPIESILDTSFFFIDEVFKSAAISVLGLSVVVSTLTLPLYLMAEKLQNIERETQKKLKPVIETIKSVFRGDERYMLISTWYRENNYHPIYSLRSSLGILIQIPFFIAAYHFISNLAELNSLPFLFIKNLAAPDALLNIRGGGVNVLPLLMTAINCVSGAVYTRGFPVKEKIQIYLMSAIFLALLYNSPAALVLYWTGNNIFSLIKNTAQKFTIPKKIIVIAFAALSCAFIFYCLAIHKGSLTKRVNASLIVVFLWIVFLVRKIIYRAIRHVKNHALKTGGDLLYKRTFVFSVTALALLGGLVIPSRLIASDVKAFSFVQPFYSPLPYIGITLLQAASFLLWVFCIYMMSGRGVRMALCFITSAALGICILNTFAFVMDYGFMTEDLLLSHFIDAPFSLVIKNIAAMVFILALFLYLLLTKRKIIFFSLQNILIAAFVVFGSININKINFQFKTLAPRQTAMSVNDKVYTFSKTGKNVLLIMLDRAISGYVPAIFEERHDLLGSFKGFTYYPNCISFGAHTNFGATGIFGGYEYTPLEIQKRADTKLTEKYKESMMFMPVLFSNAGYKVTITDQPYANEAWYKDFLNVTYKNIVGVYTDYYKKNVQYFDAVYFYERLRDKLIRVSFFYWSPLALRSFVYDGGYYLSAVNNKYINVNTLNNYTTLFFISDITAVTDKKENQLILMSNALTHDPNYLQAPDYEPVNQVTDMGSGQFANEDHYHVNIAAYILLAKWFDFLKTNGVYDNTRIIITSDHGYDIHTPYPGNITLPNGDGLEFYHSVFMEKDFDAQFQFKTDNSFMTNADTLPLVVKEIIPGAKNPWTEKEIKMEKENGATITSSHAYFNVQNHLKYSWIIKDNEWLRVHDNIFDIANWEQLTIKP